INGRPCACSASRVDFPCGCFVAGNSNNGQFIVTRNPKAAPGMTNFPLKKIFQFTSRLNS
ncbi:MAG: hypothetical protein RR063_12880, partial [Anaerovoracaceae bacterium]